MAFAVNDLVTIKGQSSIYVYKVLDTNRDGLRLIMQSPATGSIVSIHESAGIPYVAPIQIQPQPQQNLFPEIDLDDEGFGEEIFAPIGPPMPPAVTPLEAIEVAGWQDYVDTLENPIQTQFLDQDIGASDEEVIQAITGVEAVVQESNFYGEDYGGGSFLVAATEEGSPGEEAYIEAQLAPAVVGGAIVVRRFWIILRTVATALGLRGLALWNRIPLRLRQLMTAAGILAPTAAMIDWPFVGGEDFGDGLFEGGEYQPNQVVKRWTANGVNFARLADGRVAVQRKDGTIKVYRPKKPIVIYGSGATNLTALLRADGAVNRQIKKLEKIIRRRNPRPRRAPQLPKGHDHDGPNIIRNG